MPKAAGKGPRRKRGPRPILSAYHVSPVHAYALVRSTTIKALAADAQIDRTHLQKIAGRKKAITRAIATRLALATSIPDRYWMDEEVIVRVYRKRVGDGEADVS